MPDSNSIFYHFRFIREVTREKNLLHDLVEHTRAWLYNKILRRTERAIRQGAVIRAV